MNNNQKENIIIGDYSTEMKERYLEYAMSVITGRALPDVRDGLKPVHLRILYSMYELGLTPEKGYRKCARIVGDVLGKYHPHGDQSVYEALVRMAQSWNLRYPLIDGHGNFGSIDGDSSAAMRYTETKMSKISIEMLRGINKNTVDFRPNFDGEEKEPIVLPSRFPNLLANGTNGIAVGMATSIPSHNLKELIDGLIFLIENPETTIEEINKYILCPDFATGGIIINPYNIQQIYNTGKGSITIRGKYHIENNANEKGQKIKSIVFTEIPYQTNKAKICTSIANLIDEKNKFFDEVLDIRDESDREGLRIVIDIKNNADINKILFGLFKKTQLQKEYNAMFCVLVNYQPKILNLKELMQHYINFQKEIIIRRTKFDLNKFQIRLHILEGLLVAIDKLDFTIQLIRKSKNKNEAKNKLIENLSIDEKQAQAILDLKLQRLTNLEEESIKTEYKELKENIIKLNSILNNKDKLLETLKQELLEIREKYGDERRTELLYEEDNIKEVKKEDLIKDYSVTMVLTKDQYLKKTLKYSEDQTVKENDKIVQILQTSNTKDLLLFTNKGRVFTRRIYELIGTIECTASKLGEYIPNILQDNLELDEKIIYMASPSTYDKGYMLYIYENNNIVKMSMKPYENKQNRQVAQDAFNIESPLIYIKYIENDINILALSSEGKMLIQNTKGINSKKSNGGKKAQGNSFIKLGNNSLVGVIFNPKKDDIIKFQTEKKDYIEINLSVICQSSKDKTTYYNHCIGKKNNSGNFIYNCRQKHDKIIKLIN